MSDQTPATPYGPASPSAPLAPAGDLVTRARDRMRTTARVLGFASIGTFALVIVLAAVGSAIGFVADITDPLVLVLGIGSPLLATIALNILVWRAVTPGLALLSTATRILPILGIGAALAGLSVIALTGMLLAGVLLALTFGGLA